jgi:hypothetical protein
MLNDVFHYVFPPSAEVFTGKLHVHSAEHGILWKNVAGRQEQHVPR